MSSDVTTVKSPHPNMIRAFWSCKVCNKVNQEVICRLRRVGEGLGHYINEIMFSVKYQHLCKSPDCKSDRADLTLPFDPKKEEGVGFTPCGWEQTPPPPNSERWKPVTQGDVSVKDGE